MLNQHRLSVTESSQIGLFINLFQDHISSCKGSIAKLGKMIVQAWFQLIFTGKMFGKQKWPLKLSQSWNFGQ